MAKARDRISPIIAEIHHELPTSLGGQDDATNLVVLTPREHFVAHLLLFKFSVDDAKRKMAFALNNMCARNSKQSYRHTPTSRQYETARIAFVKAMTGENNPNFGKRFIRTEQHRQNIKDGLPDMRGENASFYGRRHREDSKRKMSESAKIRIASEETRAKIGASKVGNLFALGSRHTEESKLARSIKTLGIPKPRIQCPHCGHVGGNGAMGRWHFDRCKRK